MNQWGYRNVYLSQNRLQLFSKLQADFKRMNLGEWQTWLEELKRKEDQ